MPVFSDSSAVSGQPSAGSLRLAAPAKINLHLRIGPPRADGFHPLLSWMTTIGLFDRLTFSGHPSGQISMTCDDPSLPCDDRNLVTKTARLLAANTTHSGTNPAVRIHLEKKIPHGGGLGGGSSDAAVALAGLNQFWNLQLPLETLDQYAARLGSDINFFLHGPSSICSGRGEIVRPVRPPSGARWVLLMLPAVAMPTPAVYRQFDQMKLGNDADIETQPDWEKWAGLPSRDLLPRLVNDLETPAFAIEPALGNLRQNIEQMVARPVRMSGSGSSLFTLYDEQPQAESAARLLAGHPFSCRAMVAELCPS